MTRGEVDHEFDRVDRAVLNAFQGGFPVVERPFEPAAAALRERGVDLTARELLARVEELDETGAISRFGALVDAEEIGGTATLAAMHAPPERFDEVAAQVNEFREVAHNYEREHPHLNMWFVVSIADPDEVARVLAAIEAQTGRETYDLPKRREFRVEAKFPVEGPLADEGVDLSHLGPTVESTAESRPTADGATEEASLTPDERDLVVAIQGGLPVTETPYADVASAIGKPVGWVLETLARFDAEGKLRRVGLVPNHYALGYAENGMTVWDVPDDLVEVVGPAVASLEFVTHCYERPRHEGVWPYNVFAMTHGRSQAESRERIGQVRDVMAEHWDVGTDDWDTLFSTRILKKTGIRLDERAAANTVDD